ncbi:MULTISPECIES: TOPRIM nucleotidyl transferase/hydrolase domain-containing protein [Streptomyces]|uniref:OLD protein-like TOPRIM domain-containing protein n=1 Tax=Streptomyces venezuelae TaxID=54571 RepID=A0A5P2BQ36_STRVZ|nr:MULTISPECIES: TOPRIM nucleotidyl transferase/hydrolase domain-containing protein [Streptomyces]NEA01827.1 ATP-dependent endonuclease [Streptomyces sp. SID10116]MYY83678.1 ATP-dependent endonuclease [Streptomyces sp. SID335]MYZ16724.1 ATP-dependent endonuclease [Streptomyces sp. SID337]NDZ87142.1 ATP-dependent endonuclease [Streptomyces sp. SID10115]NEB45969.1 ATP-dependent endonuclease [Streptomyces sp. SID339]
MADMAAFRDAVNSWATGGPRGPASELAGQWGLRTAVLLEGPSDLAAVDALAARRGRDLAAEGVCVVPMGGAMSVGRYAGLLGAPGLGLRLTGLCDVGERRFYDRGWERAGGSRQDIHVCAADLEDELIRALGTERVEEIIREEGDLRAWQTLQRQPAHQGTPRHQQLRRFFGTKKGRKIRYGGLLTEALAPGEVPPPLDDLFASV